MWSFIPKCAKMHYAVKMANSQNAKYQMTKHYRARITEDLTETLSENPSVSIL